MNNFVQKMDDIGIRTVLRVLCCLALLISFPANASQTDPFAPAIDFGLKGDPSVPLLPGASAPFGVSVRSLPGKVGPGQNLIAQVTITIAPGYQLYAEKTAVTAPQATGFTFGNANPVSPTIEKNDPYLGKVLVYKQKAVFEMPVKVGTSVGPGMKTIGLDIQYLGCTETVCFLPEKKRLDMAFTVVPKADAGSDAPLVQKDADGDVTVSEPNPFREMADKFGLLGVLAAAFVWGVLASLTPCVYPMIPVTVSVIGAGSQGNAFRGFILSVFYVLGMSLTYAIFGAIAAWSGSLFGAYANHPMVLIIVAGVFVVLALSMLDLFYVQMPSAISSRLSRYKRAGIAGVFLTGAAAGAVVGPCVGPMLVALLVYIAALGSKLRGFLILWHFALGMGMLFLVIGTFSGAAASLPKAGQWMEKLKHFFGVIMLGVALYYVKPILPENIFWLSLGALLIGIGVFVGAFDVLSPESAGQNRFWKAAGILFLVLGIGYVARFTLEDTMIPRSQIIPQKAGIAWLQDEAAALALAREQKKPMIIDFSAEWCAACKKLEQDTFADPAVINQAKQFIPLRIDCTNTADPVVRDAQQKYGVVGLPTIIFTDALGRPLPDKSVTEFVRPDVLLKQMRQIKEQHADR